MSGSVEHIDWEKGEDEVSKSKRGRKRTHEHRRLIDRELGRLQSILLVRQEMQAKCSILAGRRVSGSVCRWRASSLADTWLAVGRALASLSQHSDMRDHRGSDISAGWEGLPPLITRRAMAISSLISQKGGRPVYIFVKSPLELLGSTEDKTHL
jgi:hypothetical protein